MAINNIAPRQSKKELAKQLGISRQSLYYKPKLPKKDLELKSEIERVMQDNMAYGHKRIAYELKINKKRILRVMKLFKLKPKRSRKIPLKPNDINKAPMNIPNLVKGAIIDAPGKIWASDFTFLPYYGRFLYLATIEDIFTREIVGWELSIKHDADLVSEALINALTKYDPPDIIHSDQGSEYSSIRYLNLLKTLNIGPSMNKKASPWENGHQESFYSEFKLELGHPEIYPTIGELIEAIARQIHYYNIKRIHTALKCPPAVFAERFKNIKTLNLKNKPLISQIITNTQSV